MNPVLFLLHKFIFINAIIAVSLSYTHTHTHTQTHTQAHTHIRTHRQTNKQTNSFGKQSLDTRKNVWYKFLISISCYSGWMESILVYYFNYWMDFISTLQCYNQTSIVLSQHFKQGKWIQQIFLTKAHHTTDSA